MLKNLCQDITIVITQKWTKHKIYIYHKKKLIKINKRIFLVSKCVIWSKKSNGIFRGEDVCKIGVSLWTFYFMNHFWLYLDYIMWLSFSASGLYLFIYYRCTEGPMDSHHAFLILWLRRFHIQYYNKHFIIELSMFFPLKVPEVMCH